MKSYSFIVTDEQTHQRIDYFLCRQNLDLSRTRVQRLLKDGLISVNGCLIKKPSYLLHSADTISITIPEPIKTEILSEDIPLDILYEDPSIIIINKPAGMVVHPAAGNYSGTLVNALLHHCEFLSGIGGVSRPGIVHRLDKDTSGVLVVAKTDAAHKNLSEQIKAREVKRIYKALVYGVPEQTTGEIKTQIGRHIGDRKKMSTRTRRGRLAVTYYEIEENFIDYALLKIQLRTGRTHQIRVHFHHIKHPVIGDRVYGFLRPPLIARKDPKIYQALTNFKRQALHAQILGFMHPIDGKYMEFIAPLPEDFSSLLSLLRKIQD